MTLPGLVPGLDGYDVLPRGRHTATLEDVHEHFVATRPDGARRKKLLDDFTDYVSLLGRLGLAVDCVWLDGSFISGKANPGDVDMTPVIDAVRSSPDPAILEDIEDVWITPKHRWKRTPVPGLGRAVELDVYGVVKVPDGHPAYSAYVASRGYWDDWWQRSRATGQALVKGYVEVVL